MILPKLNAIFPTVILLAALTFSCSDNQEPNKKDRDQKVNYMDMREPCTYEDFTDTVQVSHIYTEDTLPKTISQLNLKSSTKQNHGYVLHTIELSRHMEKYKFSEKDIKDTTNRFILSGDRRTGGSCGPKPIERMELLK